MSSNSSASSSRDELMFLGTTCSHSDCNLNDFLPFACPACHRPFCQPHFLPSVHQCSAPLPPSMVDRIAPQCPMCREVVPYPPGGRLDPNEAVERHISAGCTSMEGGEARRKALLRQKKARGQVCWRRGCSKGLIVEMRCERCRHAFCPSHRHESEHDCKPDAAAAAAAGRPAAKTANSRLLGLAGRNNSTPAKPLPPAVKTQAQTQPVEPLDARAAAAAAAMKRAGQNVKVPFVKTKAEKYVEPGKA